MQFVKTENLKKGMRLARPIYSKSGVLLFERNSLLTSQAIGSVQNFGLIGIYILEPAEPLPPMTEEDLEFERFQTMAAFSIKEELDKVLSGQNNNRLHTVANMVIRSFGQLKNKITFHQDLRSHSDYVYRHSLNVSMLCAMITHVLKVRPEEQLQTVCAALVHDVGKVPLSEEILYGDQMPQEEWARIFYKQQETADMIEDAFTDGNSIKRICLQVLKVQMEQMEQNTSELPGDMKLLTASKVLLVANRYDEMTAMSLGENIKSEVEAVKYFQANPHIYDPKVVEAMMNSINILFPGVSVVLNTGEKALVLRENRENILRPLVLSFRDNRIIDLALPQNRDIEVADIMKTMDNRYIMDKETLRQAGYLQ